MTSRRHDKGNAALTDPTRFQFWLAGRRGGKTVRLREKILQVAHKMGPGSEIFYIGPANMDAKDLIWEPLRDRLDQLGWLYNPAISKQRFELTKGRKIYVIGAEKIRRIRGHKVAHAFLDEVAFFTNSLQDLWRAVRPALSDLGGGATLATTPNGKATDAYDFWMATMKDKDWARHTWHTTDNPGISLEEVDAAKKNMDERSFRQEYEATWESFEGLAYYCFREAIHIRKQPAIDLNLPLELSFDFNVNPTTLLVSQSDPSGDMIRFKKMYRSANSSTIDTLKNFCHDFKDQAQNLKLEIYGDSAGQNRHSTTGRSDYQYIEEMLTHSGFQYQKKVFGRNPAIIDRVAWVNSWLMSLAGTHRIEIDPECDGLIRDLSSQPLDGRFPSDKNNLGHAADALGYRVSWQQMVALRKPSATIQL